MKLQTMPTVGDWIDKAPWRTRRTTALCLSARLQAFDLGDKRDLIREQALGDLLILWHGQHYTEARVVDDEAQRQAILEKLS